MFLWTFCTSPLCSPVSSFIRCPFLITLISILSQRSAQTVLRGCEEPCGSPRVRTMSGSRAPLLLSRLSETSSADESMSDVDSVPCSPLILPCSPPAVLGSSGKSPIGTCRSTFTTLWINKCSMCSVWTCHLYIVQASRSLGCTSTKEQTATMSTRWALKFYQSLKYCSDFYYYIIYIILDFIIIILLLITVFLLYPHLSECFGYRVID